MASIPDPPFLKQLRDIAAGAKKLPETQARKHHYVLDAARTSDPPIAPPVASDAAELLGRLRDAAAWHQWLELALGDAAANVGDDADLGADAVDDALGEGDAA